MSSGYGAGNESQPMRMMIAPLAEVWAKSGKTGESPLRLTRSRSAMKPASWHNHEARLLTGRKALPARRAQSRFLRGPRAE